MLAKDNTTIESNIFVYCNNDPVNFNDYTGCLPSSKKFKKAADSLWKICIKQYSWIKFSSVAMIVARSRFNKAINYIYRYSNHIKIVSMQYRVPENIIGGIILKEVFTQSISDNIANIDTFIRGANHSTGLGAIFATTARSAWKYVNPKYKLPSSNRTLQYTLSKNNYFNITTIGVGLVHKAYLAKLIKYPYQARSLSLIQWKKAVVKYNGKAIYANRVWQYLSYIHTILYAR